jgi:NTE family protein
LEEHNIPIDYIAGTSSGSIVGAAYAAGMSVDDIEQLGRSMRWRRIGRPAVSLRGLQSNYKLEKLVRNRLPKCRFEELNIPFAAVASDLATGTAVVMRDEGDVAFAVRASCTIPGIYVPVPDKEGRQLVDGGLVAVLPATVVREMGADIVIGVDVNFEGAAFFGSSLRHFFGVMLQSMTVIQRTVTHRQHEACDFVVMPKIGHIRWDQIGRMDELIRAGYEAGVECAPAIKALIDEAELRSLNAEPRETVVK